MPAGAVARKTPTAQSVSSLKISRKKEPHCYSFEALSTVCYKRFMLFYQ